MNTMVRWTSAARGPEERSLERWQAEHAGEASLWPSPWAELHGGASLGRLSPPPGTRNTHPISARMRAALCVCSTLLLGQVAAHGSLLSPMPRNAVDRDLPPYRGGQFGNGSCAHPGQAPPAGLPPNQWGPPNGHGGSCWGCNCVNGTEPCEAAQTCVWFTEGTSIGCATPGGDSPSPAPHCNTTMVATNNDPYFRTMDLDVKALSKDDKYRWNPCATPVLPPAEAAVFGRFC